MKQLIFTVTTDLTYDQRMERICGTLASEGYNVLLVGSLRRNSIPLKEKNYNQHRIKCWATKESIFYLEFNLRLFFYLLFRKADLICGIDLDTLLASFSAAKLKRTEFVYDAHEYFTEMAGVRKHQIVYSTWSTLEKMILPHVKYAYTVSQSLADVYRNEYKIDFKTIRNISNYQSQDSQNPQNKEKHLVYAGVVNEGRGLEQCIEAMLHIDAKLYICGDGDCLTKLKTQAKALDLENKVIFTGYLQPTELQKVISEASIGLLLLEPTNLNYYYSLANKFFDYLHAGIPQICIDLPEYRLLNEEYQIAELVKFNTTDLIVATNKLLNNQEYYITIQNNILKAQQELNWNTESKKLIQFYNSILFQPINA